MNYLLIFLAIVISIIMYPIGLGYALFKSKDLSDYARGIAESIDQLGNRVMQYAFDKWLIQDKGYKFGNIDETVSSVLGKNKRDGTLARTGKFLDRILNKLDKNHSIDSIEENP